MIKGLEMSYVSSLAAPFPLELRLEVETAMNLVLERAAVRACLVVTEHCQDSSIVRNVRDAILQLRMDEHKNELF